MNREAAARYGLRVGDVNDIIETRHRRQDHRDDRRRPRALSDQRPLRARFPRRPRRSQARAVPCRATRARGRTHRCRISHCSPTSATRPARLPSATKTAQLVGFVFVDITTDDIDGYVQSRLRAHPRTGAISARLLHPVGRAVRVSQSRRSNGSRSSSRSRC